MNICATIAILGALLCSDKRGVTSLVFAISAMALFMCVGAAVDYGRLAAARTAAQSAADAAALAAARTPSDLEAELRTTADAFARANRIDTSAGNADIRSFSYNTGTREVRLTMVGSVPTTFLGIAGLDALPYEVEARAVRGLNGSLEVALVLDNTWSMEGERLAALKQASEELVLTLASDRSADVKIGVVPYADYVNIGVSNRSASWLSVPADFNEVIPRTCTMSTRRTICTPGPARTCTRTVDGRSESFDCTQNVCREETVAPYEVCTGGWVAIHRWYGCVGSRTIGDLRLSDTGLSVPYPGYVETSQQCPNPIVPLTNNVQTVVSAIRGMVVQIGAYRPSTYIPAGLVWGLNVLSPSPPFTQAAPFDAKNMRPRKAMILMSDGANTLRFRVADGRHVDLSANAAARDAELQQTYSDMDRICRNIKAQGIELFTVLFDESDSTARRAMSSCASSSNHVFLVRDRAGLSNAFRAIARGLHNVRISQ